MEHTADERAGWDLIIVGGGTCGLAAAIFAGRRDARVLLLDAADELGGSLLVAHGHLSAAGTKLQRELGIEDSAEEHFAEAVAISGGTIDQGLARLAIDNAADTFDWLMDGGYELAPDMPTVGNVHVPYSKPRIAWGAELGRSVAKVLVRQLAIERERGTVTVRTGAEVTGLLPGDGGAWTVRSRVKAGGTTDDVGANVLLATGGYAANPALFQELSGVPLYLDAAYAYAQGSGLGLGVAAGGYLRGHDKYLSNFGTILASDIYPSRAAASAITYPERRAPWEIYVNARGERFVNEEEPSVDAREHALLRQPDLRYWIVFDDLILASAPPLILDWTRDQVRAAFDTHVMFHKADDLPALAAKAGLPAEALQATVAAFNAAQTASGADAMGRAHRPRPIASGPYYAVQVQGSSMTSTVGLAVDDSLRALRPDGSPIAGLYAAGEILGAGQLQGNAFVGGMMATPALTFGRLLGGRIIDIHQ